MTIPKYGSTRGPIDPNGFPSEFPGPKILVTGATGISGSHIALALARQGYKVHATTRRPDKVQQFMAKWPASGLTWTVVSDQTQADVYHEAVKGCEAVIHCAGPFNYNHTVARQMIDQSVEGILNVLKAANAEPTVRRVVHISSVAAIHQHPPDVQDADWSHVTYDDTNYNLHTLEQAVGEKNTDRQYAYTFSKKYAEERAAQWLRDTPHAFDVVTFNPSTNYGPLVQPLSSIDELDTASRRFYNYTLNALSALPSNPYPAFTAVVDLAQVVVRSLNSPLAGGQRYQVNSGYYNYSQLFAILKQSIPEIANRYPDVPVEKQSLQPHFWVDVSKVERDLGVLHWTSIEDAIVPEMRDLLKLERGKNW